MLIFGNLKTNKTEILIEKYSELLNSGVSSDEILVLVQNSKLKNEFIEKTKKLLKIEAITKFNIYSYFGLCYNKLLEFYPLIEEKINYDGVVVSPKTCGLEASRHIFKNAIDKINFKGYNSKVNLLHQLLRRLSLITMNVLSDDEIKERTKILKESFTSDVNLAINMYKKETLKYRAFDYLRQAQLFSYIFKNSPNPYKYVFLDDADEITPLIFDYLKFIKKDVKEFFIAADKKGGSRVGYLCAQDSDFEAFLCETPIVLEDDKKGDEIYDNISNNSPVVLENLKNKEFIRADEMAEYLVDSVNSLLDKSVKPSDILIVIPENDQFLKFYLDKINSEINFITGSEKIEENKTVSALISIMKLIIEPINFKISPYKLKGLLGQVLGFSLDDSIKIAQAYEADFGAKNIFEILENYVEIGKTKEFLNLKEELKDKKLSEILFKITNLFIEKNENNKTDYEKINRLLKQLRDFEDIFKTFNKSELLIQLENTIISENPIFEDELKENAVNVSSLQKAIDFKIKSKYLFLFDSTNANWIKQDIGPLYNAWVFQKNRIKKDFTLDDNINLTNNKIARMMRKLYLLQDGEIILLSSVYNFLGNENFKGIKHFFVENKKPIPKFNITPRPDQKPVLEYEKGLMAVTAVAGAGKTTIMLALIIKLLEKGIAPDNIFVLTYMDSAARTFRERIKNSFPDMSELPNISTIHGLSMRILRENNNHAHLGLDVDFDIIDEIKKLKLITEILYLEGFDPKNAQNYERAISSFKNSKFKNYELLTPSFKRIYQKYQNSLKELNLIDYDDLLILSLELLKTNSKIREYYQNLAKVVIEDEAQDSSEIQQELINIIAHKFGNIIRCGDINQAITSTFTNSDTKGFKKFIEKSENVTMNFTARNSTGVINAANDLIKRGLKVSKTSFFEIETKPIQGKNIVNNNAVKLKVFDFEEDEKKFIKDKIIEIKENDKNATIGILTRTNKEAEIFAQYLKENIDAKIITKSDSISQNPVFKAVLAIFNFISNPMNNIIISNNLKTLIDLGFYKNEIELIEKIKNQNSPFILENNEDSPYWWDLRYFLELVTLPVVELAFKIGEFYFMNNKIKKINIAPISSIVSKIYATAGNFEETLNKMNEINKKGGFNLKLIDDNNETKQGEIYVMTLHKSKGDEFDYVFIPNMYDKNLGLSLDEIKLKDEVKITLNLNNNKEENKKQDIIDENLRLFYVGLTRARNEIYITTALEYKIFNKKTNVKASKIFEILRGELW